MDSKRYEGILGLHSVDAGFRRSQDEWVRWHNQQKSIMAAAPDLYRVAKTHGSDGADFSEVLAGIQEDWHHRGSNGDIRPMQSSYTLKDIVTSTRIKYDPENKNAVVTHYYGAALIQQGAADALPVPMLGDSLDEVLTGKDANAALQYLQVVFQTTDSSDRMIETLETLSGKKAKDLLIWTPSLKDRVAHPEQALAFHALFLSKCCVIGSVPLTWGGRSRAVSFWRNGGNDDNYLK